MTLNEMAATYHEQNLGGDSPYQPLDISAKVEHRHLLGVIRDPVKEEHEPFTDMMVVPYISAQEKVVALRVSPFDFDPLDKPARLIIESAFTPTRPHIYNVGNTLPGLRTNKVIVVHDVLSCLILRSKGYRSVALPGSTWNKAWLHLFSHAEVVHLAPSGEEYDHWDSTWKRGKVSHRLIRLDEGSCYADMTVWANDIDILGVKP